MQDTNEIVPVIFPADYPYPYCWRAVYHDKGKLLDIKRRDSHILQFAYDGKKSKYQDIDRWRLGRFDLINREGKVIYSLYLHKDQRLIWRNRSFLKPFSGQKDFLTLVGWQMTIQTEKGPKNISAINYVFPDGTVALDDHRHNIKLLEEEY